MLDDIESKMQKTIEDFSKKIAGLRTNRANPDLINNIQVEFYGTVLPLQQLCTISVSDSSQFVLNLFDANAAQSIEKALTQSSLQLNPQTEGSIIRIILPALTEERRKDLVKLLKQTAEESKISLRNIRRDCIDQCKEDEKNKLITKDDLSKLQGDIQSITTKFNESIDKLTLTKESDILTV